VCGKGHMCKASQQGGCLPRGVAALLALDGVAGLHGYQWLFLLEGAPTVLLGIFLAATLADHPLAVSGAPPPPSQSYLSMNQNSFLKGSLIAFQLVKASLMALSRFFCHMVHTRCDSCVGICEARLFRVWHSGFCLKGPL
jgi:hypothetical protein